MNYTAEDSYLFLPTLTLLLPYFLYMRLMPSPCGLKRITRQNNKNRVGVKPKGIYSFFVSFSVSSVYFSSISSFLSAFSFFYVSASIYNLGVQDKTVYFVFSSSP